MCDAAGRGRGTAVSRRAFVVGGAAAGAVALLGAPTVGAQTSVRPVDVAPGLLIRPRAAWAGTDEVPPGLEAEDVRFLLVHHTAGDTDHTAADVPAILRGYHAFHTGPQKGWPDLAYNFLIDREGGVWEGRAGSIAGPVRGDATGGNQGYSQLVCLIGDFTAAAPTAAAQEAAARTLAWLADRYGVDTSPGATVSFTSLGSSRWASGREVVTTTIAGHRDMSYTACPGDAYYPVVVGELPATVSALRSSPSDGEDPPPTTGADEVSPGGGAPGVDVPGGTTSTTYGRPSSTAGAGAGSVSRPTAPAIPAAAAPAADPGGSSPALRTGVPLALVAVGAAAGGGVMARRRGSRTEPGSRPPGGGRSDSAAAAVAHPAGGPELDGGEDVRAPRPSDGGDRRAG